MRILLVDDDRYLAGVLRKNLAEQHYAVDVAMDGEAGWEYGSTFAYDLILLDVVLPKLDGVSLCQRLRDRGYRMPILLLTARDSSTDKVKGLDAGADDYVVKPFDVEELIARVRALLRRESDTMPPVLRWGSLSLNPSTCEVTYSEQPLHLTPKEYAFLELFLRRSHRVFSLSEILDKLWSSQELPGEDAVRTHVKGLRQKLKAVGAPPDLIETVYGIGYRLKSPPISPEPQNKATETLSAQKTRHSKHLAALAEAWEQCKGEIIGRLGVLEQAATVLKEGTLSHELQRQANLAAHSLAGTLGTFGFAEGSRLARELEYLLQTEDLLKQNQGPLLEGLLTALGREMEGTPTEQTPNPASGNSPLLLMIDNDAEFTQQLGAVATAIGIRTAIAPTLVEAKDWLTQDCPDVVVLKLSFTGTESVDWIAQSERLALIEELAHQTRPLPVLVVADGGNLKGRLAVIRRGGHTFLEQPVTPTQVIESVTQALRRDRAGIKVMIVDDDPQLLKTLPTLLKPWGFKITALDTPQRFWTVLETVHPDLLVLDVEMPQVSGIELCQVLRSDPYWRRLPVLFLTAHTDAQTQNQVFAIGADDYLSKPVVGAELATRILNRLERVRLWSDILPHFPIG